MAIFLCSARRKLRRMALFCALFPAGVMAAEPRDEAGVIGEVVFVAGGAKLERQGHKQELAKGAQVREGDRLSTAANGHLHLRMTDHGFIAVRPGSSLELRQYRYDPEAPGQNRVLLHLQNGTARTISGKAGESNRERYRFTTPVAAIGLRGTDYIVQTEAEVTRVSVLKGGITLNPLGPGCQADLQSTCATPYRRELLAGSPQAYLEIRIKGDTPQIQLHENGKAAPSLQSAPGEPQARTEKEVLQALQAKRPEPLTAPASALPESRRLVWGRWQAVATPTPTLVSQLTPEREIAYSNELFGLLRPVERLVLPQGSLAMRYDAGEAWLKTAQGALIPVPLGQGALTLDFDRRQFQTRLLAATPGADLSLAAQGKITFQGNLISDPARSNMNVTGIVASQAEEAGYLFDAHPAAGALYGATRWKR